MRFDDFINRKGGNRQSGGFDFRQFMYNLWCNFKYFLEVLGQKSLELLDAQREMNEQRRRRRGSAGQNGRRYGRSGRQHSAGGRFDDDFSARRSRNVPTWWRITKGFLAFLGRALATFLLIGVITGCMVGATSMVYILVYLDKDIDFDLHQLKLSYTSVIYVKDGTDDAGNPKYVEYQKLHGSQNREWISLSEMRSDDYTGDYNYVVDAVVSIEDHRFWDHAGVDWRRTVYCFGSMFLHSGGSTQGGSTITQQLIKNITGENEVSIDRKLKEIFRALDLEKEYTKDEIIESYLNVIALGNGCNGVKSAAQVYFGKEVDQLTLAEAASLVGITKNPSKYNPLYRPEKNKERQIDVLDAMLRYGAITQEQYDEACAQELVFNANSVYDSENKSYNNWYVDQIIWDLIDDLQKEAGMSLADAKYAVYNGGLQIYSSMDVRMQEKAEEIFRNPSNFINFSRYTVQPQCAIVVMNYEGAVQCIVGGRGTKSADMLFSLASQATRQPGSSMKPLSSYGPAVAYGLLEFSTPVTDRPIKNYNNGKDWPKNSGGVYRGDIPAVKGLEVSANCVAVRIAKALGTGKMLNFLIERLHFTTLVESGRANDQNLSAAIGGLTQGVTIREMTAAYAMFGNGGVYIPPYTYTKVVDASGKVIIEHSAADGERAISQESANIMNRMLRAPITGGSGTARSAAFGGFPLFGKTGTTSNDYDRYFAGGSPYYVSCCWFGYEVQKELYIKSPNHALSAWKKIMVMAHEGKDPNKGFPTSSNVTRRSYCTISGGIAGPSCPSATGWYAKNSSMPMCPIHAGGKATQSFTLFLESASAYLANTESVINESNTSVETTTTPPPVITTATTTTATTTSTTMTTSSTTTTETTTSSTTKTTSSTSASTATSATEPTEPITPDVP